MGKQNFGAKMYGSFENVEKNSFTAPSVSL